MTIAVVTGLDDHCSGLLFAGRAALPLYLFTKQSKALLIFRVSCCAPRGALQCAGLAGCFCTLAARRHIMQL